ncbi:DUF2190 family protein [Rodentibacter pneumotropicus]|uniref:DUF2190 family protein n=1 Tax=Rodentibacter pneumotropicus TaxID=758 RepID=UPI00109CD55D|nr:capsid cement protein [Rodentibacter pneumotropicus]NBH74624.1 DUF2190 family protein [Rodentibacter pneumotropicus]THA06472.1 DUF2190 family protein [Rodentibacter pneumotropicus]THA11600.1 DUF2190 family protein [Rodentibacter pneumotropicus]
MAKNFIQNGDTLDFVATKAVKSGDVVVLNDLVAIAVTDIDKNATGTGIVGGVWRVKAKQADDIKQGAVLYWSETDGATLTAGSNKRLT